MFTSLTLCTPWRAWRSVLSYIKIPLPQISRKLLSIWSKITGEATNLPSHSPLSEAFCHAFARNGANGFGHVDQKAHGYDPTRIDNIEQLKKILARGEGIGGWVMSKYLSIRLFNGDSASAYYDSLMAIREPLGIELDEIHDWNCCGAQNILASASLQHMPWSAATWH